MCSITEMLPLTSQTLQISYITRRSSVVRTECKSLCRFFWLPLDMTACLLHSRVTSEWESQPASTRAGEEDQHKSIESQRQTDSKKGKNTTV